MKISFKRAYSIIDLLKSVFNLFVFLVGVFMILQTDRLILREMTQNDYSDLCEILQNEKVMYAYEHAFSDEEVKEWFDKQLARYKKYGFGLWATVLKENGKMIGNIGLTMQKFGNEQVLEIGYLLNENYWHKGYATEAAIACKNFAFDIIGVDKVYSIIRQNNLSSQAVAKRNGMTIVGEEIKHYYNMELPHFVFMTQKQM